MNENDKEILDMDVIVEEPVLAGFNHLHCFVDADYLAEDDEQDQ